MARETGKPASVRGGEGTFLQNFSMTFGANALGFVVSVLTGLFLPQLIGPTGYGYWQLYLLYNGYMLYFSFGLTDGIHLRYGGKQLEEINPAVISGQFWLLFALDSILSLGIIGLFLRFGDGTPEKEWAVVLAAVAGVAAVSRSLLTFLLQAVNRVRIGSTAILMERVIFVLGVVLAHVLGRADALAIMLADAVGKVVGTIYVVTKMAPFVFTKGSDRLSLKETFREARINMKQGLQIVLAALAIVFAIGFLRQAIEANWGIETFAQVSLSLSLSNMFMLFVNALAVVFFPNLRRRKRTELPQLYRELEAITVASLAFLLLFFEPAQWAFRYFLPSYEKGIVYLGLLFPIFLFDGKMALLVTTFLKVLERPTALLFSNLMALLTSFVLIGLLFLGQLSLEFAILGILLIQVVRAVTGELLLFRDHLSAAVKPLARELFLMVTFLLAHYYLPSPWGSLVYLLAYLIVLFFLRDALREALKHWKEVRRGSDGSGA